MNAEGSRYSSTLGRGLEILRLLSSGPRGSQAIGNALGLNRTTAYRLVQTLVAHGLVQRHSDGVSYALTPLLWEFGVQAIGPSEVRAAGGRAVAELAERYGETVHLAIYDRGEVVYVDKADSWQPIGSYTRLGGRAPAYAVATGKVLLAYQSRKEIDLILSQDLEKFSPKTLDSEELAEELVQIKRSGYARNRGEWREDVGGMAVTLFDATRTPQAALGFSGPRERVDSRFSELLTALQDAARRISGDVL